jgi:hypothetical protein
LIRVAELRGFVTPFSLAFVVVGFSALLVTSIHRALGWTSSVGFDSGTQDELALCEIDSPAHRQTSGPVGRELTIADADAFDLRPLKTGACYKSANYWN